MNASVRCATAASMLIVAAGCAGANASSAQGGSARIFTPQHQAEQALAHAREAQARAAEQAKRAAVAVAEVQQKQRELQAAQEVARKEELKAQELQLRANQITAQAARQAEHSQEQALQALSQATARSGRGEHLVRGTVSRSDGRTLIVQPQGGTPMTLDVGKDTLVRIDGRQASTSDIRPGENALVSYGMAGAQPTAVTVQISRGMPGGPPAGTQATR